MEPEHEGMPLPPGTGMNLHSTENSIKYQIESDDILETVERTLKNQVLRLNRDTGEYQWSVVEDTEPIINEKGINKFMLILRSRLTKVFILSNLNPQIINNMVIDIGNNVIDLIYSNWDLFGIQGTADATLVNNLLCDNVHATLKKGEGIYLKFLGRVHNVHEIQHRNIRDTPSPTQGTGQELLGKLFGRKRKY